MASTSVGHAGDSVQGFLASRQTTGPHAGEAVSVLVHDVILKAHNRACTEYIALSGSCESTPVHCTWEEARAVIPRDRRSAGPPARADDFAQILPSLYPLLTLLGYIALCKQGSSVTA